MVALRAGGLSGAVLPFRENIRLTADGLRLPGDAEDECDIGGELRLELCCGELIRTRSYTLGANPAPPGGRRSGGEPDRDPSVWLWALDGGRKRDGETSRSDVESEFRGVEEMSGGDFSLLLRPNSPIGLARAPRANPCPGTASAAMACAREMVLVLEAVGEVWWPYDHT